MRRHISAIGLTTTLILTPIGVSAASRERVVNVIMARETMISRAICTLLYQYVLDQLIALIL